jgi:chaperone BCS1
MSSPFGDLSKLIPADNQFFAGGFGLAALGAGAAILRRSYQVAAQLARRHLLSTLEVTSKDRAFPWVLNWLSTNGHHSQHLSVETSFVSSASSSTAAATPSPHAGAVFGFVPGPGMHVVRYRKHWIAVERTREMQSTDLTSGRPWEKVTLTILGRRTDIFTTLLREAFERATRQTEGKTIVYTNWGAEWRPFGQPRRRRPISSVVLDTGVAERVLNDVQEWRRSSRWYIERGIPYRRGYLLYGPPGSGKSSFITAVAGELQYNICILNLAEHGLTDDRLSLALSTVPPQSVILLEVPSLVYFVFSDHSCFYLIVNLLPTGCGCSVRAARCWQFVLEIDILRPAQCFGRCRVVGRATGVHDHQSS